MFHTFERVVGLLARSALVASTLLVAYLMGSQVLEVIFRTLGSPTIWVYDFSLSAIVGTVLLGIPGAELYRDHVVVDFFTARLGGRATRILAVINAILALLFLGILVRFGIGVVIESLAYGRTTGGLIPLPAALTEVSLPIGASIMALQVIVNLVRTFRPAGGGPAVGSSEVPDELIDGSFT